MFDSILDCIGNTPLIKLKDACSCNVYVKLEFLNPGGSMKDRTAKHMIEYAEKNGLLKPNGTIIEASSGNQGAALAMIGAAKGYKVIITASTKISDEKLKTLKAYGAEVKVFEPTKHLEDPESYYSQAKKLSEEIPNSYWPNQYHNSLNPEAHYLTTGQEIWSQTEGKITHFFCATGSTGTIMGIGKYLKEKNPNIKIIGIDHKNSFYSNKTPAPYKAEGIGIDYIPKFLDHTLIDEIITIDDYNAFESCKKLAKEQGLLVGGSAGAVYSALLQYLPKFKKEDLVVCLFADSGKQYLSKIF